MIAPNNPPERVPIAEQAATANPNSHTRQNDQDSQKPPPSVVVQVETPITTNEDRDHHDDTDKEIARYTAMLAIFTAALVVVGYLQYRMMGEHKKGLEGLLGAIKRQTDLMNRNNVITLTTARSAQESAKAANAQIQMVKDKERARLEIEIDDFVSNQSLTLFFLQSVNWRVRLNGQTEATILQNHLIAYIDEPEIDPLFGFGI